MRYIVFLLFKLSISGGILYYLFTFISVESLMHTLTSATPVLLFMAFLVGVIEKSLSASQMKMITDNQRMDLSWKSIFQINLITNFYGLFLPGSIAGGAIRWYKLSQPQKMRVEALAAIGFNRVTNLLVLVIIGVGFWMMDVQAKDFHYLNWVVFLIFAFVLLLYIILVNHRLYAVISTIVFNPVRFYFVPRIFYNLFDKIIRAVSQFHDFSFYAKLRVLGLSLGWHILNIVGWFFLAQSLGLSLTALNLGWIRSCINIITLLPLTIAGLGVREGALIVLLQPYGIDLKDALSLSLLIFSVQLLWGTIGGMIEGFHFFKNGKQGDI